MRTVRYASRNKQLGNPSTTTSKLYYDSDNELHHELMLARIFTTPFEPSL